MNRLKAEMLLLKCRGDEIWSLEVCQAEGIPANWIEELQDCFESGFDSDLNTIYHNNNVVNQFHGLPDLMIAYRLAEFLGIDIQAIQNSVFDRKQQVQAMVRELDEIT